MRERLLFIYNPNAGKAKLKGKLSDIVVEFSENGYEVIVMPTAKHGDATEFAKEYAKDGTCSRIVCAGGDGTLNEVVTGVMESGRRVPIGYIPAGTTNDFGYSLKIPKDAIEAAKFAATTDPLPSDVGEICGSTFVYTAAFGLFSDVSYDTSQDMKNILGRVAYLLRGVRSLVEVQNYQLEVEYLEAEDVPAHGEEVSGIELGEPAGRDGIPEIGTCEPAGRDGMPEIGTDAPEGEAFPVAGSDTFISQSLALQGEVGVVSQNGVPESGVGMPVSGNSMPENGAGMFVSGNGMPENGAGMPVSGNGMPESGTGAPACRNNTPEAGKSVPAACESVQPGRWHQVTGEFICGMVANSNSVGGFKGIMGKGVRFDDGVFEMLLIRRPRNLIELTDIVNELVSKKLKSDNIVYAHVREVRLEAKSGLPWSLDGEFGGDMPQATIHIRQQAVDYIRKEVE